MPTTDLAIIIPVFKFREMSDTEVYEYGVDRKNDIDGAGPFGSVAPSISDLDGKLTDYSAALAAFRPGDKHSTRVKNRERRKLETMLMQMAWSCATISADDFDMFALSGFAAKKKGVPHNSLDAPLMISLLDGPVPNALKVFFQKVVNRKSYEIEVSTDSTFAAGVTKVYVNTASPFVIPDLQSDVRYYVRVRAIGARGLTSNWSLTANRKVQ